MRDDDDQDPREEPTPGDYEVGYGKPPRHSRFQPGRSGNPRGRPKGTKNLKTDLQEELREKVLAREGDHPRRVSKQRAMVKSLMARALKGDVRAANLMMTMMFRLLDTGENAPEIEEPLLEHELEILRDFGERSRRDGTTADPGAAQRDDEGPEGGS